LAEKGLAEVRSIDFLRLFGSGVLHTKFMIIDEKHVYVGSANMDWRSLTEVKELGVVLQNCSCMAIDLQKIFVVYWRVAEASTLIPEPVSPSELDTNLNPMLSGH
jgi:phospholipase D3/4